MLDAVFNSLAPYCYYLAAGLIACIVALCFDILKGQPPENYKKCIEAVLCGCIAFALCGWVQSHYSSITKSDCLYLAVGIGAIGAGLGIGRIGSAAMEAIARQPESAGEVKMNMIIAAALVEGVSLFAVIVCLLCLFM